MKRRLLICLPMASLLLGVVGGLMVQRPVARSHTDVVPAEPSIAEMANPKSAELETGTLPEAFHSLGVRQHSLTESSIFTTLLDADASDLIDLIESTQPAFADERYQRGSLISILAFARLTELDAEAAWTLALEEPGVENALALVFDYMLQREATPFIAERMSTLPEGGRPGRQLADFIERGIETNPVKTIEILKHLPDRIDSSAHAKSLFITLTEQDAGKAIATLETIPPAWRSEAIGGALSVLIDSEPLVAIDLLTNLSAEEQDEALQFLSFSDLTAAQERAVFDLMERLPHGHAKSSLTGDLVASKLQANAHEAVAWMSERITSLDKRLFQRLISISKEHPEAVAKFFNGMPRDQTIQVGLASAVNQWLATDKDAATDWMATISEEKRQWLDQQRAYQIAVDSSDHTAEDRITALTRINDSRQRITALRQVGRFLEGNEEKLNEIDINDGLREELELYLTFRSSRNFQANKDRLAEIDDLQLQQKWAAWTADQMLQDPSATASWLGDQPHDFYENESWVVDRIASEWATEDPHAASQWIANLPESAGKDQAIARLAASTRAWDPETALAWTATISDPSVRGRESTLILNTWAKLDPSHANRVLAEISGFTTEEKQQLALQAGLTIDVRP